MVRRVALASLVLGLLWVGVSSAQPAFPDKTARLVELAQVWAKVKVFHPYLGYKDLDWDAALVAAIPKVEAAATPAAYRAAIQDMLGKLGDPVTRMIDTPAQVTPPASPALLTWATPEIAQISLQAYFEQNGPMTGGSIKLIADSANAKVIVFDLRNARTSLPPNSTTCGRRSGNGRCSASSSTTGFAHRKVRPAATTTRRSSRSAAAQRPRDRSIRPRTSCS